MRRPDTRDSITRVIEKLREAVSNIVLRTTVIVGFPSETDRQFDELIEFIEWARFDALGCFEFYPESGADAAKMPNQIPDQIKQHRADQLMLAQQEIAFAENQQRIGTKLKCLVDSIDADGHATARFYGQAPDIDSVCIIEKCSARPGQFVDTKVIAARGYDLVVEQI
jgi:ribosomal protein S12 methylthiotransferase